MNPWTLWLETLRGALDALSVQGGLGLGLAIVATTLLFRTALLPLFWRIAYRSCARFEAAFRRWPTAQEREIEDLIGSRAR